MKEVAKKLHQKSHRFTKQRKQILHALTSSPQSVAKVMASLEKKGISVDKATIYRTLDCFVNLGIAGKTQFRDKTAKYELLTKAHHHHHLVCDRCGSVEDIFLNESVLLTGAGKQTDFQIKSHSLEFFGFCTKCQ